ncbi:MAG: TonB family protein [Rhodanobacteraceae bacterium]|jgi:TonB family protein|nr:TonB family protein [Rhodanobacteraceae bacterium]
MSADLYAGLVNLTVAGSLALLGVLAARGWLRRRFGAQLAYAAWLIVPLTVLAVLLPAPLQPLTTVLQVAPVAAAPAPGAIALEAPIDWRTWLLLAWGLGAVALAAYFAWQQRRYRRSLGRLCVRGPRIVAAEHAHGGPALLGAWRPRLVLPADFGTRYTPSERALILAHERVHLARGDTRINAAVAVLRCLNWFNPLIHLAATRLRFDQELACDAAVIARFPHARRRYADAMLKTQLAGAGALPAGCHWSSTHPLKERIAMLKQPLPTRARRLAGTALVALLGLGGAYAAWAAQTPRPATAAATPQVDAQLTIAVDGGAAKAVRLVHPLGAPFGVKSDDAAPAWDAEFVAQAVDGGNIELATRLHRDGRLIGEPVIVAKPGQPASIEVGEPGKPRFRVQATLALRDGDADAKPAVAMSAADREAGYARLSPPRYPPAAIGQGVEGLVIVQADIDASGGVTAARVERIEPPTATALGEAALDAVRQWTFTPARRDGHAVAGQALVPLRFSLDSTKPPSAAPALPPGALDLLEVRGTSSH